MNSKSVSEHSRSWKSRLVAVSKCGERWDSNWSNCSSLPLRWSNSKLSIRRYLRYLFISSPWICIWSFCLVQCTCSRKGTSRWRQLIYRFGYWFIAGGAVIKQKQGEKNIVVGGATSLTTTCAIKRDSLDLVPMLSPFPLLLVSRKGCPPSETSGWC